MKILILILFSASLFAQLSDEEMKLFHFINDYRVKNGLTEVVLNDKLNKVAHLHLVNVEEHIHTEEYRWSNRHSWFPDKDNRWEEDIYNGDDENYSTNDKPKEVAGYSKKAFEVYTWWDDMTTKMTAGEALRSWIASPGHKATILQKGSFSNEKWTNCGVAIYKGAACAWFGSGE